MAREAQRFANANPEVRTSLQRVVERLADASRHAERRGDIATAFTLARDAVLLDPRRSWMRRRAELLRMRRRSEYDGGRDLAAYRTAAAALSPTPGVASPHYDAALALLGSTARWREAAALADRVGTEPTTPWARLALARGRLARGDVGGAVALARQVPCHEARDPELVRALRVLTGTPLRPGDAVCEVTHRASGDTPWLGRGEGPFDAEEGSFEGGRFGRWMVLGTAFGTAPMRTKAKDQTFVNGWRGQYFASSYARNSDTQMGMLRSRSFVISTDAISFLAGGGNEIERVGVRLIVDGQAVARSTGSGHEGLRRMWWDVRPWRGRNAVIEVYDNHAEGWGHIMVDDFVAEPAMPTDLVTLPVVAPTQ
jgi:hypothetical protein